MLRSTQVAVPKPINFGEDMSVGGYFQASEVKQNHKKTHKPSEERAEKEEQGNLTHLFCHLEDAFLTGEQDGRGQHALSQLAPDAFVQPFDAFFLHDREQAVQRRLVPQRVRVSGLQPALHDAVCVCQFTVHV